MTIVEVHENNLQATIRELKRRTGVRDEDIAEVLDTSRAVVQQRMTSVSKWRAGEIKAIADFFGVPLELLYMEPVAAAKRAINDFDLLERFSEWIPAMAG